MSDIASIRKELLKTINDIEYCKRAILSNCLHCKQYFQCKKIKQAKELNTELLRKIINNRDFYEKHKKEEINK